MSYPAKPLTPEEVFERVIEVLKKEGRKKPKANSQEALDAAYRHKDSTERVANWLESKREEILKWPKNQARQN